MAFNVSCESTEIMLIDHGRSMLFFPGWRNTTMETKLTDHANNQPTSSTVRHPRNRSGTRRIEVCPAAWQGWRLPGAPGLPARSPPARRPGPAATCGDGTAGSCHSGTAPDSPLPWTQPLCISVKKKNKMRIQIGLSLLQNGHLLVSETNAF